MANFGITGTTAAGEAIKVASDVVGLDHALRAAAAFGERMADELARDLYQEAETIITASKLEVPVDTGALRGTAHVRAPVVAESVISVEAGYGGPATPYALRQHEEMDYAHTVGNAKYLEGPYRRQLAGMDERIAARLQARANG